MKENKKKPSEYEVAILRKRRIEAMHLQVIEGNPLNDEQVAMFEMFEHERWTQEQRLKHLEKRARAAARR